MRLRLLALLIISLALLAACNPTVVPPATPAPSATTPTSPSSPTAPDTPAPTPAPSRPTSEMPLNVTLHHMGVRSNQAGTGTADIYLLVIITDGYEKASQQFIPTGGAFQLAGYQSVELNQDIFHTDSVGNSLKVCVLAYKRNDPQWQTAILVPALEEIKRGLDWGDYRSAQEILSTIDKHMEKAAISFTEGGDSLIGYFEDVWGTNESLGIGQYNGVGTDDFRLWFSIWSTEPPKTPPAPVLLPDIELEEEDINAVSTASTGQIRTDIVKIHNNEPHPITVILKGSSLLAGEFYNSPVEMAAEGYAWVEIDAANPVAGVDTITYEVFFNDTQLVSESVGLRVITDKRQLTLVEWRNIDGSHRIGHNILDGTPVTLYIEAPGYTGVPFSASIRRVEPDGSYSYEETLRITIINGRGLGQWKAEWQPVLEGDPTYVFGVKDLFSDELTVVKKYERPPEVSIESVDMASYVNTGEVRTDTVTIRNDEDELIIIRLRGNSSLDGEFYNSAVSVPAEGTTIVDIPCSFETAGIRNITYQLYFQGISFSSWSSLLDVF